MMNLWLEMLDDEKKLIYEFLRRADNIKSLLHQLLTIKFYSNDELKELLGKGWEQEKIRSLCECDEYLHNLSLLIAENKKYLKNKRFAWMSQIQEIDKNMTLAEKQKANNYNHELFIKLFESN